MLPELIRFFADDESLARFLRRFAGVELTVPDLALWTAVERDLSVAKSLRADPSPVNRVRLIAKHGMTLQEITVIYKAVYDRALGQVRFMSRDERVKAATEVAAANRKHVDDVATVFGVRPEEIKPPSRRKR